MFVSVVCFLFAMCRSPNNGRSHWLTIFGIMYRFLLTSLFELEAIFYPYNKYCEIFSVQLHRF